jgi:hypothetical protein
MTLFAVLMLLYLTADFADPGMPGAFNFDADQSVEVAYLHKATTPYAPAPAGALTAAVPIAVLGLRRRAPARHRALRVAARRAAASWPAMLRALAGFPADPTPSEEA